MGRKFQHDLPPLVHFSVSIILHVYTPFGPHLRGPSDLSSCQLLPLHSEKAMLSKPMLLLPIVIPLRRVKASLGG